MKLDRNLRTDGKGKYALIKLRECAPKEILDGENQGSVLVPASAIDYGNTQETDFFVIRLKDKYAAAALAAYAGAAMRDDSEYATEVFKLSKIASQIPSRMPD